MTRITPELAPRLKAFPPPQREGAWPASLDLGCTRPTHKANLLVESGFEPGSLQSQDRYLTNRSHLVPNHGSLPSNIFSNYLTFGTKAGLLPSIYRGPEQSMRTAPDKSVLIAIKTTIIKPCICLAFKTR
ncbi:hypothetical protein AVEN_141477-1 [Araneus ventricosus]|uniref:Uncharacterized protein n=1 Tax=Araneus ventricosus TaxID=182803 RepID=A0A4Y2RI20_ARAVE|nr:hypothetical protein AVEN_141477-1 [Araneus ventricosus]